MKSSCEALPLSMFTYQDPAEAKRFRLAIVGLSLLSGAALVIAAWTMNDFVKEQAIVQDLIKQLPQDAKESARDLIGELEWQFRLTALVIVNVIATAIALALLWRAYRASQASLMDARAIALNIVGSMEQAVITTDVQDNVTSINRRATELLNLQSDCIGQSLETLTASIPLSEFQRQWIAGGDRDSNREFVVENQGTQQTLRASCRILKDREEQKMGNVMQVRDITEQRLIEDRLRRMERYMGLGALAGGLHHEIKNPLAALSLHVQLLEEELESEDSSEDVRSMLKVIQSEVNRIGGVLESFRDFASIDELDLHKIDLNSMVQRQVKLMQPKADNQQVCLLAELASDELIVNADVVRLEQVLLNLIINALEVMSDGGKLTIITGKLDGSAHIEVHDTGPGIPESLQNKILDPYFTTKTSGTGLGLAYCDKIIRQHAGTLDFNTSNSGTAFRLSLPLEN